MSIRIRCSFAVSCGAVLLATNSTGARADSSGMDWLAVGYVWAAQISADAGDRSADLSFSDIVDKLDMGLMGHVEAQGDDFGGFADVVYMSIGDSRAIGAGSLRGSLDMSLMDLAVVWSPAAERYSGAELYGGLRYMSVDAKVHAILGPAPAPEVRVGIDDSYTDILLGARYAAPINDQWRLFFSGDLSAGDTEGSWSLGGYGVYRNGPHRFYAGYRHLEAEITAGGGRRVEQTFSGPVFGYGYAF